MKKGSKMSEESIQKLRDSHRGQRAWNKGLDKSDPRVAAYSRNNKRLWTPESRIKLSQSKLGTKLSPEVREKLSAIKKGKKPSNFGVTFLVHGKDNVNWKGGITSGIVEIRGSLEYRIWRKTVLERDNYTCQECGQKGVKFHVDHIKRFADYPELRLELSNGRTLCIPCHKATPTYGNVRVPME